LDRLPRDDRLQITEDAVQHTVVAAALGAAKFAGAKPPIAVAWCRTVLTNCVSAELRARGLFSADALATGTLGASSTLRGGEIVTETSCFPQDQFYGLDIMRVLERAEVHIQTTYSARQARGLLKCFRCYLEWVLGASINDQVHRYATKRRRRARGRPCRTDLERARALVYQYHHRGKVIARELLAGLTTVSFEQSLGGIDHARQRIS
jgi:hypothetical protein